MMNVTVAVVHMPLASLVTYSLRFVAYHLPSLFFAAPRFHPLQAQGDARERYQVEPASPLQDALSQR